MYTHANKMPKLSRSLPGVSDLPSLCNGDDACKLAIDMPFDRFVRSRRRLHGFRNVAVGGGYNDAIENIHRKAGKTLGYIMDALTPKKYDFFFSRRMGFVKVPQGRLVSEREWAASETSRTVQFSPRIRVSEVEEQKCFR